MGKIIQVISGAWHHLWTNFDSGHAMIPPIQVGIAGLCPVWWVMVFNFLAVIIFVVYQVQEYYEKRFSDPQTADRAHHALKGYLTGLVASLAIVAIIWRIMEVVL